MLSPGSEDTALGISDGRVLDSNMTESSCYEDSYCATWGRYNDADSNHCWMPSTNDTTDEYIQVRHVHITENEGALFKKNVTQNHAQVFGIRQGNLMCKSLVEQISLQECVQITDAHIIT